MVRLATPEALVVGHAGPAPPQAAVPLTLKTMDLPATPALWMSVNVAVSVTGPPATPP